MRLQQNEQKSCFDPKIPSHAKFAQTAHRYNLPNHFRMLHFNIMLPFTFNQRCGCAHPCVSTSMLCLHTEIAGRYKNTHIVVVQVLGAAKSANIGTKSILPVATVNSATLAPKFGTRRLPHIRGSPCPPRPHHVDMKPYAAAR